MFENTNDQITIVWKYKYSKIQLFDTSKVRHIKSSTIKIFESSNVRKYKCQQMFENTKVREYKYSKIQ